VGELQGPGAPVRASRLLVHTHPRLRWKVLGTFANDYKFVRDPSPLDRELTEMITRTAAMAIEQDRHARLGVTA